MNVIITGATGMVGSETVRQALLDTAITKVTAIVRKPLVLQHPKLNVIVHQDFLNFSSLSNILKEHDACLWCLGISQNKVKNEEEYHTITYDYAVNAAKVMLQANPSIKFLFLSGMGADSKEKSRTLFARIKGKTENALLKLPFKQLYIARPGGIKPSTWNPNAPFSEKIMYPLFPLFKLLLPSFVITAVQLAHAMLYVAKNGSDKQLMENVDLLKITKNI
jgi:uncharacterized protein YbjT (DUF2867 family)